MKAFWTAWWRGLGILAFYFCLSLALGGLGLAFGVLPVDCRLPVCIVIGPPVAFWISRWLAPDLFGQKADTQRRSTEFRT